MKERKVLLVEDDSTVATCLTAILQCDGYEVLQARNGPEAIRLAGLHRSGICLVLCDVLLSGESGAAVAMKLREVCPRTRILFLSGYPLDILFERRLLERPAFLDGWAFFLQKPFVVSQLRDAMEHVFAAGLGFGDCTSSRGIQRGATAY
jgi:CheY-like chemotaxis protein